MEGDGPDVSKIKYAEGEHPGLKEGIVYGPRLSKAIHPFWFTQNRNGG